MRPPEASSSSKLHLPQRPPATHEDRSRRMPLDRPALTIDSRRARDFISDRTTLDSTNGFASSRLAAPEMPSKPPTRSKSVSSSEEGEVSEDEAMDVDPTPAVSSATGRGHQSEANIGPGDDFSLEERAAWYQGRSPDEPARPGVLDDSMTVATYIEAQLLVLDILGCGIPPEKLFRGFGISTALLTTIFNDLHLRLPKDLNPQEPPTSPQSRGEEPVLSSVPPSAFLPSLGDPSSGGRSPSELIPKPSLSPQVALPSPSDPDLSRNPTLNQTESSGGEPSIGPLSGEELQAKRTELLRAQLQKRKAQTLRAMSARSSTPETPAVVSRASPSPAVVTTAAHESSDLTNTPASDALTSPPRAMFALSPKPNDEQPVGNLNARAENPGMNPQPPSLVTAVSIEVLEPSTPLLNTPGDPNGIINEVTVTTADEGQEVPVRKRTKLDLLLREKLAKVKAKEAVASRSKSPSVPPSQPLQVSNPAGNSEGNPENPMLPQGERSMTETKLDAGVPPSRIPFQPPRSSFFSYDVPPTSASVSLDYGLPSPSPEVPHGKPVRSYSYDSRSVSRPGKRLRATDFIDDTEVRPFLPMLDSYTKIVIDISEDEGEVEEQLREDTPVDPSEDAQAYPESRATGSAEPGEPASADAFLGSLMDELVEPTGKVDPSDEIKRLKAKIAAMEAMHKKRTLQREESSRQASVDPIAQEILASEAECVILTPSSVSGEDALASGWIPADAGDDADVEDEAEPDEEDERQDEEIETDPPLMYTVDEDGDQGMHDAASPTANTISRAASPAKVAANAVFGSKDHMVSSSAEAFDTAEFAKYQNPIGWYDTASNHPVASSHTIQHSQGVIDLMPLRAQALTRYDPNKQLCQYEVPGGGTCLDPTCGDCHIRDTLPTDEETAKYLAGVFPGLDIAQIRSNLLRARKSGSSQLQGFTAIVAEALRLLGLR
ncbi:hypothetical protein FS837_004873 [Tulasnella sp. UAMH 9824]|nr:hypothetical protein FS837_004873 [Tulasnella sp. UAMH 9824]